MIDITEPVICRSVGRDPDNPSNREKGCNTEQTLELKKDGISNTLTTVQKDNYVVEPQIEKVGNINNHQSGSVINPKGLCPCICVAGHVSPQKIIEPQILKYERTDYAKSIRKEYESGQLSERRCNMRQYTTRKDGVSNTLTTVQKDNLIIEPKIKNIGSINGHQSGNILHQDSDLSPCLCVAGHVEPLKIMQVGNIVDTGNFDNPQRGRIYDPEGLSPALNTMQGGGLEPKFIENKVEYRIRKLTPRECFRLMGFSDSDFDKIKGISNTQLYKMAGNSIVVNVLEEIFRELFKAQSR